MKKLILFFNLIFGVFLFSQPDLTTDLKNYTKSSQFISLVGQKIYAYQLNPAYNYSDYFNVKYQISKKVKNEFGVFKPGEFIYIDKNGYEDLVASKFFIVESVDFYNGMKVISPEQWDEENRISSQQGKTVLKVSSVDTNNKFIFEGYFGYYDKFISVPFFENIKSKYIGNYILKDRWKSFKEIISDDNSNYCENNIFLVKDIFFHQSNTSYSRLPELYLRIENINKEESTISFYQNKISKKDDTYVLQKDYDKLLELEKEKVKKQKQYFEEKHEADMKDYREKKILEDSIKLKKLIKIYGSKISNKLINKEVWIGMTRDMLIYSQGDNYKVGSSIENSSGYIVEYRYGSDSYGTSYYLKDGKLISIINY